MVNPIDDDLGACAILHHNPDVPAIKETDPERIALIMRNQKTKSKVTTSVIDCIYKGQKKQALQVRIAFPELPIVYNRLPSKEWFYLITKTKKFVIIEIMGDGMARDIATFLDVDLNPSIGEQLGFAVWLSKKKWNL